MSIFEIGMLVCFGAAWPASIYKSWKSKKTNGKSLPFLCIIWLGYVSGIINKAVYNFDFVIYLYILNLLMVTVDILLFLRNTRLDKSTT